MNSQSIEFDKIKEDPAIPKIIRKSFRVPIEDSKSVWVVIQGKQYPVKDICLDGIGIVLEAYLPFSIDQTIKNCELTIHKTSIKNLNGRVVHLSSTFGKDLQCGIQWIDMEEKAADQISKIVLKMKEQLLKDDSLTVD